MSLKWPGRLNPRASSNGALLAISCRGGRVVQAALPNIMPTISEGDVAFISTAPI